MCKCHWYYLARAFIDARLHASEQHWYSRYGIKAGSSIITFPYTHLCRHHCRTSQSASLGCWCWMHLLHLRRAASRRRVCYIDNIKHYNFTTLYALSKASVYCRLIAMKLFSFYSRLWYRHCIGLSQIQDSLVRSNKNLAYMHAVNVCCFSVYFYRIFSAQHLLKM